MRVSPEDLITAARRLAIVESDIGAANVRAAASTTRIAAAAQDELSQSLASVFSTYGEQFHAAVEQTGILGTNRFAERMTAAASSYSGTEASNNAILIQLEEFLASFAPLVTLAETDPILFALLLIFGPFFFAGAIPVGLAFLAAELIAQFILHVPSL